MRKFIEIETIYHGRKGNTIINIENINYVDSGTIALNNDEYLSLTENGYKNLKKFLMEK